MKIMVIPINKGVFNLGIGDLINKFASLKISPSERTVFLFPFPLGLSKSQDVRNLISDILKNKGEAEFKFKSPIQNKYVDKLKNNEINPALKTNFLFSKFELDWARSIIQQIGIKKDKKILVVCNNVTGKILDKMWLQKHWIALILEILNKNPDTQVVFLPNFRKLNDFSDEKITNQIIKKHPNCKVFIFQSWLRKNINKIIKTQNRFGFSKNRQGFTLRQFSAIIRVLMLNKNCIGVFNDSAPVHAASAALGKDAKVGQIISVNVLNKAHYAPRNRGIAFAFFNKDKRIKTGPLLVAKYINQFFKK